MSTSGPCRRGRRHRNPERRRQPRQPQRGRELLRRARVRGRGLLGGPIESASSATAPSPTHRRRPPSRGVGGTGTLTGVASVTMGLGTTCAILVSGVWTAGASTSRAKWGTARRRPGRRRWRSWGSGGHGTLSGVSRVALSGGTTSAVLVAGGVDCWGANEDNQLGVGSLLAAAVRDTRGCPRHGGAGTLTGVKSVTGAPIGFTQMFCAVTHVGRGGLLGSRTGRRQLTAGPGAGRGERHRRHRPAQWSDRPGHRLLPSIARSRPRAGWPVGAETTPVVWAMGRPLRALSH